jgi:tRNA modification GTPase
VAITGKTNTGKSSLLNLLLNEEKAIVSEIPGTTRDNIEDVIVIDGIQYRFIDTAGLRETKDVIEKLGIKRTYDKIDQAAIVLLVADVNEGRKVLDDTLRGLRMQMAGKEKKLIILINKTDADANGRRAEFDGTIELHKDEKLLFISAKTGSGIDNLKNMLGRMTGGDQLSTEDVIITNIRHYEALTQVSESLERVMHGLGDNIPADLIAIDIRQAIHYLGEITGEITTDEILGNIFKNFCIGK